MRMSRRSLLLTSVMALALSMLAAPALATTPSSDGTTGRYIVVTLTGKAFTRVEGSVYTADASINLDCQVTETRGNWTLFRVTAGVLTVNGTSYAIVADWHRGIYNARRHVAWFEGRAQNAAGEYAYFIIFSVDRGAYHGEDEGQGLQGTLMKMRGVFQDPTGAYWKLAISAYRQRIA